MLNISKTKQIRVADGIRLVPYFSTFPIGNLIEKQTAAEFLKNSKVIRILSSKILIWIPLRIPVRILIRIPVRIHGADGFGWYLDAYICEDQASPEVCYESQNSGQNSWSRWLWLICLTWTYMFWRIMQVQKSVMNPRIPVRILEADGFG